MSLSDNITADEQAAKNTASNRIPGPRKSARKPAAPVEDPLTDEQAEALEAAAEQNRVDGFNGSDCHKWAGRALHGFSSGREALWTELRTKLDAPPLSKVLAEPESFFPDACRILFLCYFAADDPQQRRGDTDFATVMDFRRWAGGDLFTLQSFVDTWADEHIGGAEKAAAVNLAITIWREAQQSRAEVTPSQRGGAGRGSISLGESPRR